MRTATAILLIVGLAAVTRPQAEVYRGSSSSAAEVVQVASICSGVFVSPVSLLTARHCFAGVGRTLISSPERAGYTGKLYPSGISGSLAMVCAAAPTERIARVSAVRKSSGDVEIKGYGWYTDAIQSPSRRKGYSVIESSTGTIFTVKVGGGATSTSHRSVPCSGDSGGPAYSLNLLVGIAEGYPGTGSCGDPHTYTSVTSAEVDALLASTKSDCLEWVSQRTKKGPLTDEGPLADKFLMAKPGQ